jgi:aryl-alcohol dehydrogenase-like predicted oxidoreductase
MAMAYLDKYVLGTAQFGLEYGIAKNDMPTAEESQLMLAFAAKYGVRSLDTAPAYGEAEALIGQYHEQNPMTRFRVTTKISKGVDCSSFAALEKSLAESRRRIKAPIDCVLLHDSSLLFSWTPGIEAALQKCVDTGLSRAVGVSVYTPEELQQALLSPVLSVIQCPFNVIDQRLRERGLLTEALNGGKHIVIRSLFLQGLLLLTPDKVPAHMEFAKPTLAVYSEICARFNISRVRAAIGYVLSRAPQSECVVGVHGLSHLEETIQCFMKGPLQDENILRELDNLTSPLVRLIDPRAWSTT